MSCASKRQSHQKRFDSTYEGLKRATDYTEAVGIPRFDSTYEGLKPFYAVHGRYGTWQFRQYL